MISRRGFFATAPPALALLLLSLSTASSLPGEGWRARDRFAAFRFECSWPAASASSASDVRARRAFAVAMRDYADELSAFGWAQLSHNGSAGASVVGEFRGTPSTAPLFRAKLERGPAAAAAAAASAAGHRRRGSTGSSSTKPPPPPRGYHVSVRDYEDTRIHLHFATFLLLDDSRETCFEDGPPHACPAAAAAVGEDGGARGGAASARGVAGVDEDVNVGAGAGAGESVGGGAALDGAGGSAAAEPDL